MRQRHSRRQSGAGANVNLTPLIDMVFILLIFFIVTASFVKETGVEVSRPSAKTAVSQAQNSILIAIRASGEIWLNGHPIDIRTVRAHIERALLENPTSSVVIVADKHTDTGRLIRVMDQVRLAGVSDISIAATPKP